MELKKNAMEIRYQSKSESKKEQQEAFLKLPPIDRFYNFLDLCERLRKFPVRKNIEKATAGNFVIEINLDGKGLVRKII
jgi:hypothetical protein